MDTTTTAVTALADAITTTAQTVATAATSTQTDFILTA